MKTHFELEVLNCSKEPITLTHQCKTELGIQPDEVFHIDTIIGAYSQVRIINQYGQRHIINPNQIADDTDSNHDQD